MKVLANIRAHAPQVPVIVRTQDDHDLEKLQAAGATEVVPEAIEGSLMLASHALALVGVPMRRVIRIVQDQRDARYNLLRGYFHGADDNTVDESHAGAPDHRDAAAGHASIGPDAGRSWRCTPWACAWSACAAATARPWPLTDDTAAEERRHAGALAARPRRWRWPKTNCSRADAAPPGLPRGRAHISAMIHPVTSMHDRQRQPVPARATSAPCRTGRRRACSFATSRRCCRTPRCFAC